VDVIVFDKFAPRALIKSFSKVDWVCPGKVPLRAIERPSSGGAITFAFPRTPFGGIANWRCYEQGTALST